MLDNKKDFLSLLACAGDCLKKNNSDKPLRLQTACGNVLLHLAVSAGHIEDVTHLLKLGISPHARVMNQKSAVCRAVEEGYAEIIDVLTRYGANVNEKTSSGQSFLDYAVSKGYADVVDALMFGGVDPNVPDKQGLSPLYRAAEQNDFDTAEVLFENNAEIYDHSGLPLIHLAVFRNSIDAIQCFSDLGFDLDLIDSSLQTPLYRAAKLGNLTIVKKLIENEADLYGRDSCGHTLLHIATDECNLIALKTLLDAGMDVNITGGWWGCTPLHVAAERGNLATAKVLIERNGSPRIETMDGRTPLSIAKAKGNSYLVELFSTQK